MILRNIRIQGFGCFADEIEVGPFGDGINLLYAPNGTGKSTLVKAFTSALVDSYKTRCAELEDWKPWGRRLSPRVVVEFEHGGAAYRLEKRFLQGAASVLQRKEGAAWNQYMQNDHADDFVRGDILNCTPPGSGLAKPKHWGLAQILWTTQGDLALPDLSGNVVESIQRSVGASLTAAGSKIESRLASLFAEFFTPTRATLKKTAPLNGLQREVDRLTAERAIAEQDLADFDRKSGEIDDLRTQLGVARENQAGIEVRRETAAERGERYRELQGERLQQAERKAARQALCMNLKQRTEAIRDTRRRIVETEAAEASAQAAVPLKQAEVDACTKACYRVQEVVASASKGFQQTGAGLVLSQMGREYVQATARLEAVSGVIADVCEIDARIGELAASRAGLRAPDAREVAKARKLAIEEQNHALRLEMARITAEIEPAADGLLRVIEAEQAGEIRLHAGTRATIPGSPNLAFEIPGFGSIRVRGPATDYASIRGQLEKCRAALGGFEERFKTRDVETLESMRAAYAALDQQIAQLEARRAGLLGKDGSNTFEAQREQLSRRISEIEQAHPEWRTARPDPAAMDVETQRAFEAAKTRLTEANQRCDGAQEELVAAEKGLTTVQTLLTASREKLDHLRSELQTLMIDGKTDAERQTELDQALLEYDAAQAALNRIDEGLRGIGGDPAPALALLDKELKQAEDRLKNLEIRIVQAETEIALLGAKSPYERLATLTEAAGVANAMKERERRRMDAIKLLNTVMVQTKDELLKTVAGPVEKGANENLAAICVRPFGEIRMSSAFGTVGVRPDALEPDSDGVAIAQLSGGEKEQLHLCARLALASELAKDERQLLVLDDVLTFTDDDRLSRICDLLERSAEKLQILILTCHPERFIGIGNARPFDLEAVIRSRAGAGR